MKNLFKILACLFSVLGSLVAAFFTIYFFAFYSPLEKYNDFTAAFSALFVAGTGGVLTQVLIGILWKKEPETRDGITRYEYTDSF